MSEVVIRREPQRAITHQLLEFPENNLSSSELLKPYILDGASKIIHTATRFFQSGELVDPRNRDYAQISEDGSKFCAFSSDSQNSFYFGPNIFDELKKMPTTADVSSIQKYIAELYVRFNNPTASEAFGTFGVIFNTPDKKTIAVIANCGGSVYLYRPNIRETIFFSDIQSGDKRQLYELADQKHSGSIGYGSNPSYLHLSTIMLQPRDTILVTPNQINNKIATKLKTNLSKVLEHQSYQLAQDSADIIRKLTIKTTGSIKDATALVITAITTSSYIDDRSVSSTHFLTTLPQFQNAKNFDELFNALRDMKVVSGLNQTYPARKIIQFIRRSDIEAIPRGGGLRATVLRLLNSPKNIANDHEVVIPQEIA